MKVKKVIRKIKEGTIKESMRDVFWVLSLTKRHWLKIFGYLMLSFLTVGFSIGTTLIIQKVINALINKEMDKIFLLICWYMGICIGNVVITMILRRVANIVGFRVYNENITEVYDKILVSDWELLSKHHSGDLISRLSKDVDIISQSVVSWIPELLTYGLQIIVSVALITYFDASILFVFLGCIPFVLLGTKLFWKKMYFSNQEAKKVDSILVTFEKESFHHIQTIKAFNLTSIFSEKMKIIQKDVIRAGLEFNKYSILSWGVMYMCGQIAALCCAGWAVYHVYKGVIDIGTMTSLALLATYVGTAFKSLINVIPNAMSTVASAERIRNLYLIPYEKNEDQELCDKIYESALKEGAVIEIENMSFSYQTGRKIFDQVSLNAGPGEIIALVGPSGEGKTTLLRIILGIVSTATGNNIIYVGSKKEGATIDISPVTRKLIAYVPQGNTMMSGTIADNMRTICPEASDSDIIEALESACAYDFVKKLPEGIYQPIGESGNGFSEGQNQRLSIARALLLKSPILLLDEATSALDIVTERKVLHNLMKHGELPRTCILTTHRPSVLSKCNRVYRISDSKIRQIQEDEITQLMNDF